MKDEKPGKSPETTSGEDQPIPTATPTTQARRRLLKRLATGSGVVAAGGMLPQKWTAPMVQSVLLPAHATSTPTPGGLECGPEAKHGQLTCMTLMNTGGASAGNITLHWDCPGGNNPQVHNEGLVAAGGSFTICGGDGASGGCNKNVFQNTLEVRDNGVCEAKFHTSCSSKIGPGTQCGPWLITAASVEGGDLANVGGDTQLGCDGGTSPGC